MISVAQTAILMNREVQGHAIEVYERKAQEWFEKKWVKNKLESGRWGRDKQIGRINQK